VLRPADANEVAEAWKVIMRLHHEPAVLILTRQAVPTIDRTKYASASGVARGAYVLADPPAGKPDALLLASGIGGAPCLEAHERLKAEGIKTRVVSMPSWELFDDQPKEYRDRVLPPEVTARVSVEQASTFGWARYVGATGHSLGMRSFGASAPLKDLQKKFGFTAEAVAQAARQQLGRSARPERGSPITKDLPCLIQPLLVGSGVLVVRLLSYGAATALLIQLIVRLIRSGYHGLVFWKNVVVMTVITLITAVMHLSEIALWAVVLRVVGETSTFERAFYA